jgi:uncharacterized protein
LRRGIALALVACSSSYTPHTIDPDKPTRVRIGDATVTVEIAELPDAIRRGLSHRQHLDQDAGMLFVMPREQVWTFWMRDTPLPLDMIFIKSDLSVAGIVERAAPQTDTMHRVRTSSRYVLEVNAGWAAAHAVKAGERVEFENVRP